jgi:hypothetical protein
MYNTIACINEFVSPYSMTLGRHSRGVSPNPSVSASLRGPTYELFVGDNSISLRFLKHAELSGWIHGMQTHQWLFEFL